MARRDLYKFLTKVAILFSGIAIGVICTIMLINFSEYWASVLGLINILVIGIGYLSMKYNYQTKLKRNLKAAAASVKNIFNPNIVPDKPEDAASQFLYEEIMAARKLLQEKDESREEIFNIVSSVATNMDLHSMLADMTPKILEATQSNCGAFYLANMVTGKLELKYSSGFNKNIFNEFDISLGEGLIGSLAEKNDISVVNDIPDDTIYISRTFLGNIKPKSIMVVPVSNHDALAGVLVLSSIVEYNTNDFEQAGLIRYYLGIAIGNGLTLETNKRLASELKFQNNLIQGFNAELEKKVMERSLLFDNIINSIQEYGIYSMDKDGYITTWNKGAENLTGYKASEVIGEHVEMIYPEDEVKNGLVNRRLNIVRNEGKYMETTWRNKKGGVKFYGHITIFAIKNDKGELVGFTNVTRDVTGIRSLESIIAAERDFRNSILEHMDCAIVLANDAGAIRFANKEAQKLVGLQFDKIKGRSLSELFEDSEKLQGEILASIANKKPGEVKNYRLKSSESFIDIGFAPIKEELPDTNILFRLKEHVSKLNIENSDIVNQT